MFLAPLFLTGLLAIGLPIWLHRIAREERIKLPFASLMLLEASEVRDTSRRSLRYLVLLALRIAFIIAVALAFAGPLFKPSALTGGEPAQLHAIVLDGSLSMQYGERWQRAQAEARKLIDNLKSNDRALLVWASGRKIELVAGPIFANERNTLYGALATLKPNSDRLDYGLLMTSSQTWLSADGMPAQLHLITDAQQSASPLRFADLQAPPNAQVIVHDIGADVVAENTGIVSVEVRGARERTLTVNLRGADRAPIATAKPQAAAKEVTLFVDEKEFARKPIAPSIVFSRLQLKSGTHRLRISVTPNDALPQDDNYYAVIEHTEPAVLLVTRDPKSDEAAYLAAAIESQGVVPLTVVHATPASLATTVLNEYSAVVVADSGIVAPADAKRIERYIDAGGAAFITLGPQAARLQRDPITDMEISKTIATEQRVEQVDDSHPVLRDAAGWRAVRFMRHVIVAPGKDDRSLLTLQDESPLLIERPTDSKRAGRTLLLTAPLNREWNDLGIHPLFVRFIADAASYLTGRDATAASYLVGAQVTTGIVSGVGGQIFDPDGERALAMSDLANANRFIPERTGFYEVRSENHKRWVAVNIDAREADLTPMTADTVKRWQSLVSATHNAAADSVAGASEPPPRSIGWNLVLLAAVFLLSELLLANYRLTIRRDGASSGEMRNEST
jgi:hypothetical protein